MWPSLSTMVDTNSTIQDKISYFRTITFCQNLRLQNDEDVKTMGQHIQTLIGSPLTRYDGLLLWNCALSKSQLYLPNWGRILAAGLQCHDSFAVKEQCSIVLKKMVLAFGSMTEYSGAFHRFLPELIPILLADSETNQGFVNSCESLTVCMTHFPQLLGPYMAEIERFVMNNLNTDSVRTIESLSDLFAAFPRCLEGTFKPKVLFGEVFQTTVERTVNTLHSLLNDISSFQSGNIQRVEIAPKFEIPCPTEGGNLLFNRIRTLATLSHCLAKMMSSEAGRVRASVEHLLMMIARMFDFDFNEGMTLNNQDGDMALLFLAFPKICDAAFILLEALVLNFSIDEQSSGIMALVMRAINISQTSPHASLFFSQVRSTIWKFLNIWIHQSGCRVTSEIVSSRLIKELLFEIDVRSTEVNDETVKLFQYSSCIQALKALSNLHISGGCFIEEKDEEAISTAVLRTVRKVQLNLHPSKSCPCPYSNEESRVELYNLLLTCSISGKPSLMMHTLKSVNLFKIALRDPSIKVKEVCHRGFSFCRYYLHPKKPPPDFMVYPKPATIAPAVEENNLLNDWGTGWQTGQLNGHTLAAENAANPSSYPEESSYAEASEASEMAHDEHTTRDSPHHFTELRPVNSKKRTLSQQSSQSYGEDSDSDDDKDSSFDEEEEHPPRKKVYTGVAPRARPTIQMLETHSSVHEQQQVEDSLEVGANAENAMPEQSDGYEEDNAVTENGERDDESEGGEEEFVEEEEDEEVDMIEEEQSPQTEEPPTKKQRAEPGELLSEEESSHNTEREEVTKSDDCQEAASNDDHQGAIVIGNAFHEAVVNDCQEAVVNDSEEAVANDCREAVVNYDCQGAVVNDDCRGSVVNDDGQGAVVNDDSQEAVVNDDHHKAIDNVDHQESVNDDFQGSVSNIKHQVVDSGNHRRTLSIDEQDDSSTNKQEEAIRNQEVNGENEDSDDSSRSNEEEDLILPESNMTVDEIMQAFVYVEKKR